MQRRTLAGLGLALTLGAGNSLAQEVLIPNRATHQCVVPNARSAAFVPHHVRGSAVQVSQVAAYVTVIGPVAHTRLQIEIHNPAQRPTEAELLVPVPAGATISGFDLHGAQARLLPSSEARRTYEEIVARLEDPALLEFASYAAVRTSVFPVPANGTLKLSLSYQETLTGDGARIDYELPRSTMLGLQAPFDLTLEIQGKPLPAAVYSPTHQLVEKRRGQAAVVLELASTARHEAGSFRCSILRGGDGLAASLMACPDDDGEGGTFLIFAGLDIPGPNAATLTREVTIVLDRSGSMRGVKFEQARSAALQVLEGLRPGELFRIVDYSDSAASMSATAMVKDPSTVAAARAYLRTLEPNGGTNIGEALTQSLQPTPAGGTLAVVLFLTDGLPTVGDKSESGLRKTASDANSHARRLFTFGVGNDVNAPLLDSLASASRGVSTYVRPNEDVEVAVSTLYKRLAGPLLADLQLRVLDESGNPDTTLVRDLLPRRLPDLYSGEQLILVGRYTHARLLTLELTGRAADGQKRYKIRGDLRRASTHNDFVPRLWAGRRIAELTDEVRQAGGDGANAQALMSDPRTKELTEEIVRLSLTYGVLSEFTAFLAREETTLGSWSSITAQANELVVDENIDNRTGAGAVNIARNYNDLQSAKVQNLSNGYWRKDDSRAQVLNAQPIRGGVLLRRGEQWIQGSLLDGYEGKKLPQASEVIEFGSAAHARTVVELLEDGRGDVAGMRGQVLITHRGRTIQLENRCAEKPADSVPGERHW